MMYFKYLGTFLVVVGVFFVIIAMVGMIRFPNFYIKVHTAGIIDSLSSALILIGTSLQNELSMNMIKMILIVLLIWLTSTTTSYVLVGTYYNACDDKHD